MSTFFPAGGMNTDVGPWWRVLHSSLEAGADLNTLRLLHAVGAGPMTHDHCTRLEQALSPDVACVRYDPASLLIIEPGVTDYEVLVAAEQVLDVTREQLRIWRAVRVHTDGLEFVPLEFDEIEQSKPAELPQPLKSDLVLTDAEFSYFPMWDVRASKIFGYVCENVWNTGDGGYVSEDALEAFLAKHRYVFALDKEALHKAVAQAQDFLDRYVFTSIVIPVHYSTITNPDYTDAYVKVCNEGIWTVHENVFFEITKVPVDVDSDALGQAISTLVPYGQGVWLRVHHEFSNFACIPADMVHSIGLGFHYDGREAEDVLVALERFAQATQGLGVARHAHGLEGMDTCISAVNFGYDYISSEAIAPAIDGEQPVEMAQPSDILRAMLKS